jgi:hypothetical protein
MIYLVGLYYLVCLGFLIALWKRVRQDDLAKAGYKFILINSILFPFLLVALIYLLFSPIWERIEPHWKHITFVLLLLRFLFPCLFGPFWLIEMGGNFLLLSPIFYFKKEFVGWDFVEICKRYKGPSIKDFLRMTFTNKLILISLIFLILLISLSYFLTMLE